MPLPPLVALFFVSGATGLVYEVVWSRQLQLVFGVSAFAIATVVAAYMAGLALGSALFGRLADRSPVRRAARIYGLLELGIGLFALGSLPLLGRIGPWLALWLGPEPSLALRTTVALATSLLLLLVPTVLMGGTLPLLSKCLAARSGSAGQGFSRAYAANTAGAVAGTLLAGFVLPYTLGYTNSLVLAGMANLALGVLALVLSRRLPEAAPAPAGGTGPARVSGRFLLLVAVSGFVALAIQMLFVRAFATLLLSTAHAFALVLAVFLAGIALGAALATRRVPSEGRLARAFALLAAGCLVQLVLLVPTHALLVRLHGEFAYDWRLLLYLGVVAAVVLPVTLASGAILPLVLGLCCQGLEQVGRAVGRIYLANTLGAVCGVVCGGFLLLPWLGPRTGARVLALATLVVLGFAFARPSRARLGLLGAIALVALFWPEPAFERGWVTPGYLVRRGDAGLALEDLQVVPLARAHGLEVDAAVTLHPESSDKTLWLNGMPNASVYHDRQTQIGLSLFAYLLAPRIAECAHIGLGSGITAANWAALPGTARTTIVELEQVLWPLARHFGPFLHGLSERPGVRFVAEDGRAWLARQPARSLDLVIAEPSQLWAKGTSGLFTREHYELAKTRLRADGVYVTWIMGYEVPAEVWAIGVRTLLAAFPHVLAFQSPDQQGDVIFVCAQQPLACRHERWQQLGALRGTAAWILPGLDLEQVGDLQQYFLADHARLAAAVGDGELQTDDRPVLEALYPRYAMTRQNNALVPSLQAGRWERGSDGRIRRPIPLPGLEGAQPRPDRLLAMARFDQVAPEPLFAPGTDLRAIALGERRMQQRSQIVAAFMAAENPNDLQAARLFVETILERVPPEQNLIDYAPSRLFSQLARAAVQTGKVPAVEAYLRRIDTLLGGDHCAASLALAVIEHASGRREAARQRLERFAGWEIAWPMLHEVRALVLAAVQR